MFLLPDKNFQGKLLSSRVYPEFFRIGAGETVLHAGCGNGAQVISYGQVGAKIIGIDIQDKRVQNTVREAEAAGIINFSGLVADLEALPFDDGAFDKIIAVDIIQHVVAPAKVFSEFKRVLKPGGKILITFPALQHYWLTKVSGWKNRKAAAAGWNPDEFSHNLKIKEWLDKAAASGLILRDSHATTLWPPLHRYGIPRFWFSNNFIHRIDYLFGGWPMIKYFGQALMCIYGK